MRTLLLSHLPKPHMLQVASIIKGLDYPKTNILKNNKNNLILKKYELYFLNVYSVYVCLMCMSKCPQEPAGGAGPLELELQAIVRHVTWVLELSHLSCNFGVCLLTQSHEAQATLKLTT